MLRVKLVQLIDEACCAPVLENSVSGEEAERMASALRVVADPARLRIISLIASQPGAEACVCNLTEPLGLSQPTVSHHLRVLHDAGILERNQRGRWAFYRLRPERLELLRGAYTVPATLS